VGGREEGRGEKKGRSKRTCVVCVCVWLAASRAGLRASLDGGLYREGGLMSGPKGRGGAECADWDEAESGG
jgi:hypothetical protein